MEELQVCLGQYFPSALECYYQKPGTTWDVQMQDFAVWLTLPKAPSQKISAVCLNPHSNIQLLVA